jgi:hypothetical protein
MIYLSSKNMEFSINLATGQQEFLGNVMPGTPQLNFDEGLFIEAEANDDNAEGEDWD